MSENPLNDEDVHTGLKQTGCKSSPKIVRA